MDSGHALHTLSTGKLLLAFLPEGQRDTLVRSLAFTPYSPDTITTPDAPHRALADIRNQGYAVCYEERAPGAVSLAVPVREPGGRVRAALGLYAPTFRMSDSRISALLEEARTAAASLEAIWFR